jgi:hypothetical protein
MLRGISRYVARQHWGMLATFIALGGTAYAATALPANSVGTRQLKNGSVTRVKLATGLKRTIAQSHRTHQGAKGDTGRQGPQGPKGDRGPQGQQGAPGVSGANGTNGTSVTSTTEPAGANCPGGGSKFTAANGVTYACNGTNGAASVVVRTQTTSMPEGLHYVTAMCNTGERATGGGWTGILDVAESYPVTSSQEYVQPGDTPAGWSIHAMNPGTPAVDVTVYVLCATS